MLKNPFTPSFIASAPDDFFGRADELRVVKRALGMGCVAIHGPIGIGKSSLLARAVLEMEGFGGTSSAQAVTVTLYKDVTTIDHVARQILESLVDIDEAHKKVTFKIGSFLECESGEITRNFTEGRHVAALQKLLGRESLKLALKGEQLLIIAVDEADKCPVPLAQLVRAITSDAQHAGVKSIRFLLAGVSPFYERMLTEDRGIERFIYRTISLDPMAPEDAADLLQTQARRGGRGRTQFRYSPRYRYRCDPAHRCTCLRWRTNSKNFKNCWASPPGGFQPESLGRKPLRTWGQTRSDGSWSEISFLFQA